jgi:hypothetical protein
VGSPNYSLQFVKMTQVVKLLKTVMQILTTVSQNESSETDSDIATGTPDSECETDGAGE